jgi:hypothetical protein
MGDTGNDCKTKFHMATRRTQQPTVEVQVKWVTCSLRANGFHTTITTISQLNSKWVRAGERKHYTEMFRCYGQIEKSVDTRGQNMKVYDDNLLGYSTM